MTDKLEQYRRADAPLPATYRLWPLYGAGFESLGRDGQPIEAPMPAYGPDELLIRTARQTVGPGIELMVDAGGSALGDTVGVHVGLLRDGGGHLVVVVVLFPFDHLMM